MSPNDEYYEEEEAPAPAKKRRVVAPAAAPSEDAPSEAPAKRREIRGGWAMAQEVMQSNTEYAKRIKVTTSPMIVKFLEPGPYASYKRHWVKRGKTSAPYTCLQSFGEECPLCNAFGDAPKNTASFNVAIITEDGDALHRTWDTTPGQFNKLRSHISSGRVESLTDVYFEVYKTGTENTAPTDILPIKPALLFDSHGINPVSDEVLSGFDLYDASIIEVSDAKTLREVAAEIRSSDDY